MNKEYKIRTRSSKTIYIQKALGKKIDEEAKKVMDKIKDIKKYSEELRKKGDNVEQFEASNLSPTIEKARLSSEADFSQLSMLSVPPMGTIQRASNGLWTIQGMRIEHVTMLREIGINSVYDLSIQNPDDLHRKIIKRGRPHEKDSDWIPTKGMIVRWIRIAKKIII